MRRGDAGAVMAGTSGAVRFPLSCGANEKVLFLSIVHLFFYFFFFFHSTFKLIYSTERFSDSGDLKNTAVKQKKSGATLIETFVFYLLSPLQKH